MATIVAIMQLEEALETCAAALLTAAGLTTHRQRSVAEVTAPAVSVQVAGVVTNGKQYKVAANVFNYPADFGATLTVRVVTERSKNASSHATYVGTARADVFDLSAWSDARLPLHKVAFIEATGSAEETDAGNHYDVTALTFRLVVFVKPAAWPA